MIVTGSRGEYGYVRPILHKLRNHPDLVFDLVVTNMHLLPEFGFSEEEITKDGFAINYRLYNTLAGYNTLTMSKSLGLFLLQFPEIVSHSKPDIILISGDRGEMLMSAIVGSHMNTVVAHIQAGEVTGNIDGSVRHAITKLSHIHFASNSDAKKRVLMMGEQDFRVFNVGAPLVDDIVGYIEKNKLPDIRDIYNLDTDKKIILFVLHPVTEEYEMVYQNSLSVIEAINRLPNNYQVIVVSPNSDAGCLFVKNALKNKMRANYKTFDNLPRIEYISFMNSASLIIGNSSSGIMEAPSLKIPCINIGNRQNGRMQAKNVINADYNSDQIFDAMLKAFSREFVDSLSDCENPYGDGKSSERIITILREIDITETLINKKITY